MVSLQKYHLILSLGEHRSLKYYKHGNSEPSFSSLVKIHVYHLLQLLLAPFVVLKGFPQAYKKLTVPWPLLQHERSSFQF